MCAEVELLLLNGSLHSLSIDDVLLGSVLDTNETKSKADVLTFDHSLGACSLIHDINLGDDTNCSNTLWITITSHLETIRCGQILIGWQHAENDCSTITNVPVSHGTCDLLDVIWLVRALHWNTSDTWEIDQGQIWAGVGEDVENDGFINNVFTLTTNLVCQVVNSLLYFIEVSELLVWHLIKLSPWLLFLNVIESELKGSTGDNTITSW